MVEFDFNCNTHRLAISITDRKDYITISFVFPSFDPYQLAGAQLGAKERRLKQRK